MYTAEIPPPDMLVRTSGEVRLSDFLLWQVLPNPFLLMLGRVVNPIDLCVAGCLVDAHHGGPCVCAVEWLLAFGVCECDVARVLGVASVVLHARIPAAVRQTTGTRTTTQATVCLTLCCGSVRGKKGLLVLTRGVCVANTGGGADTKAATADRG